MEWQYQCERKPCCGRSWCLTGKNQTSKINITGKARTAVAWTDTAVYLGTGCQCDERSFQGQGAKTFCCASGHSGEPRAGYLPVHGMA